MQKSTNPTDKPVSSIPISLYYSDPVYHNYSIDSFVRDASNRLLKFIQISFDSTQTTVQSFTYQYVFNYTGNDTLPDSYTILANGTQVNKLRYDQQKRVKMDSSTVIHNTFYFSYTTSGIILYQDLPSYIGHYVDTMSMDNNGNIATRKYWFFTPFDTLHNNFNYTYTTYLNPIRFPGSIGLLLLEITGRSRDYLSKNLISQSINNSSIERNPTWSTDEHGRVVKGEETISISGKVVKRTTVYKYE